MARVLVIEPFYGGSHKQLLDTIFQKIAEPEYDLFTLPAKKWHWRARTSALYFSQTIPFNRQYSIILCSSVLNLAELVGMRPDLCGCKKIVYFHENQLIYPVQEIKERDCQYGLNQIMTCLAADKIVFNSNFNRSSFLNNIHSFLNIQSDMKLKNIRETIEPKCSVLYFPIDLQRMPMTMKSSLSEKEKRSASELHLIWPHRWEHDKNPALLISTLLELNARGVPFKVSIVGETFQTNPECFNGFREQLNDKLINFGYLTRENYHQCLLMGDIVISTADHEFYGVSMLEAVYSGCVPLAPNKLVYPELYPAEYLYNTPKQLIKILSNWCRNIDVFRKNRTKFFEKFSFEPFDAINLVPKFVELLT